MYSRVYTATYDDASHVCFIHRVSCVAVLSVSPGRTRDTLIGYSFLHTRARCYYYNYYHCETRARAVCTAHTVYVRKNGWPTGQRGDNVSIGRGRRASVNKNGNHTAAPRACGINFLFIIIITIYLFFSGIDGRSRKPVLRRAEGMWGTPGRFLRERSRSSPRRTQFSCCTPRPYIIYVRRIILQFFFFFRCRVLSDNKNVTSRPPLQLP